MTSLKTKNICFLAAFLFLAIDPTLAKVVLSASECKGYEPTPPEIPGILEGGVSKNNNIYKIICQTYANKPWYLTVYDTKNKTPVFSAYEYKGSVKGDRFKTWMIEPQLDVEPDNNDNMMKEDSNINYNNQAIENDYDGNGVYHKGHLFPVNHASDQDELDSTFTLTNAVPQHHNFNTGRWRTMEGEIKKEMDKQKQNKLPVIRCFVVVGAKPGNTNLNDKNKPNNKPNNKPKKEVNIPSMMWSAFRCTNGVSGAYWDDNIKRDPGVTMTRFTLQQLQTVLVIEAFP